MSERNNDREDELGALWEKEGSNGLYMTGKINGQSVVVFKNRQKKNDKHPDWRVLKAKPRTEQPKPADDEWGGSF